jgi:hypothetical protein
MLSTKSNTGEGIYVSRQGSRALIIKNKLLSNGMKGVGVQVLDLLALLVQKYAY